VWGVFGFSLGGKTCNVSIIALFDPLGGQEESCPNRDFEVQESGVFNIPFRGLVIGFLVFGNLVSETLDLLTKLVFHLMVDGFVGSNGLE
jgi:hypothetical protein